MPADDLALFITSLCWKMKKTGNWLVEEPSFAKAGCPETTGFDTSEAWAQAVCACMADYA